jgi:hypothetical protein
MVAGQSCSKQASRRGAGHAATSRTSPDTARIRVELGYTERVDRAEALARTVAWERENPPPGAAGQPIDYADEDGVLAKLGRI